MHRFTVSVLVLLTGTALAAEAPPYFPDNAMTPGIANPKVKQSNINKTICNARWLKAQMPSASYLNKEKGRQLRQVTFAVADAKAFTEDHRIPIELGGHPRHPKNLWPQSTTIAWNAVAKDKLEAYVHGEVCAGRMKLADGRAIFQRDWTDVFRLYCGPEPDAACQAPGAPGVQIADPKRPDALLVQ